MVVFINIRREPSRLFVLTEFNYHFVNRVTRIVRRIFIEKISWFHIHLYYEY